MAESSLTRLDEVMAPQNATFTERWEREHTTSGSKGGFMRVERMRLRSQGSMGFSTGKVNFSIFHQNYLCISPLVKTGALVTMRHILAPLKSMAKSH